MRTLLELCQEVMEETGYNPPSSIQGNNSPDAKRLVRIVNRAGNALATQNKWRRLTYEATVSTSATTTYNLPSDFYEIVNDSMWSRTETEEASGPLNEQEWQMLKGTDAVTELVPEFRLEYNQGVPSLVFLTAPGVQTIVYEYRSKDWIVDTSSSATASLWSDDLERTVLDEEAMYTEIKWRWMKAKGIDYAVDYEDARVQLEVSKDSDKGGSKKLSYGGRRF